MRPCYLHVGASLSGGSREPGLRTERREECLRKQLDLWEVRFHFPGPLLSWSVGALEKGLLQVRLLFALCLVLKRSALSAPAGLGCVSVSMCVSIYVCICVHPCVYLCTCLWSVSVCVSVCIRVCVLLYLCIVSVCPCIRVCVGATSPPTPTLLGELCPEQGAQLWLPEEGKGGKR